MSVQPLQTSRVHFTINLHPSRSSDALEGVRDQLSAMLLRWNEDLQGVPLTYSDEQILVPMAAIHSYFPFMQVKVTASLLVFCPRIDMRLCGSVMKVGADFLGLHVLGIFNAAIGREQIRPELSYRGQAQHWQSWRSPDHRICEGDQVIFAVTGISTDGGVTSMTGSLMEASTGEVGFLSRASLAAPSTVHLHSTAQQPGPVQAVQAVDVPQPAGGEARDDALPGEPVTKKKKQRKKKRHEPETGVAQQESRLSRQTQAAAATQQDAAANTQRAHAPQQTDLGSAGGNAIAGAQLAAGLANGVPELDPAQAARQPKHKHKRKHKEKARVPVAARVL